LRKEEKPLREEALRLLEEEEKTLKGGSGPRRSLFNTRFTVG